MSKIKHYFFLNVLTFGVTLMKTLKKYVGHISCQNRIITNFICFIKKMWSTFTRLSCLNLQYITLMWQISFLVYYWNCKAQLWSCIMNWIYSTRLQTDTLKSVENSRCEMLSWERFCLSCFPEPRASMYSGNNVTATLGLLIHAAGNKRFTSTIITRQNRLHYRESCQ